MGSIKANWADNKGAFNRTIGDLPFFEQKKESIQQQSPSQTVSDIESKNMLIRHKNIHLIPLKQPENNDHTL